MSILILTHEKNTIFGLSVNPNYRHFFPANRAQTYREMLQAYAIPHVIEPLRNQTLADLQLYQAIIVTCAFKHLSSTQLGTLKEAAHQYGIAIISDSFLVDHRSQDLFGIQKNKGVTLAGSIYDQQSTRLYEKLLYPHSEEGAAFGIRPLIRLILQNWLANKMTLQASTKVEAIFSADKPAIISNRYGLANNLLLNFHPSLVFKNGDLIHRFFKQLITQHLPGNWVSINLQDIACLRMDDPGSSERVHLEGYNCGVIAAQAWQKICKILNTHQAMLNVAYVPMWVDDGDRKRGRLYFQGQEVNERIPGKLYPSWQINYNKKDQQKSHFYSEEYEQIKRGVDAGLITILSHGLTHLSTRLDLWSKASDKYSNMKWYREFREMVTKQPVAKEILLSRLQESRALLNQAFGKEPSILVPSAHEQTAEIPEIAAGAGFSVCSSRATFLLKPEVIANRKIKAYYPSEKFAAQQCSLAGYPIIYTFHDYDIYQHGPQWLEQQIAMLKSWGIKKFWSLETLSALLMTEISIRDENEQIIVDIQLPCSISKTIEIPLLINRKINDLMIINNQFVSIASTADGPQNYCLNIPAALVVASNHLQLRMIPV